MDIDWANDIRCKSTCDEILTHMGRRYKDVTTSFQMMDTDSDMTVHFPSSDHMRFATSQLAPRLTNLTKVDANNLVETLENIRGVSEHKFV